MEEESKTANKKFLIIFLIVVIILTVGLLTMLGTIYYFEDKNANSENPPSNLEENMQQVCDNEISSFQIVESIPYGEFNETILTPFESTIDNWSRLFTTANHSIDIACYYFTLNDTGTGTNESIWDEYGRKVGQDLMNQLIDASKRGVLIRIAQNAPFSNDSLFLSQFGYAEVREVNYTALAGSGIIHTKFIIVDEEKFYVGSANMDWRALTQVKEMGITVTSKCLAADLLKTFEMYWEMGVISSFPSTSFSTTLSSSTSCQFNSSSSLPNNKINNKKLINNNINIKYNNLNNLNNNLEDNLNNNINNKNNNIKLNNNNKLINEEEEGGEGNKELNFSSEEKEKYYGYYNSGCEGVYVEMEEIEEEEVTWPFDFHAYFNISSPALISFSNNENNFNNNNNNNNNKNKKRNFNDYFFNEELIKDKTRDHLLILFNKIKENKNDNNNINNNNNNLIINNNNFDLNNKFYKKNRENIFNSNNVNKKTTKMTSSSSNLSSNLSTVYMTSAPIFLCPSYRTNDLDGVLNVIENAKTSISISLMDYVPTSLFQSENFYWDVIDSALRRASYRKVYVRLLLSIWAYTRQDILQYANSLDQLENIQVMFFVVPPLNEGGEGDVPYTRVNHAKYMVSDSSALISTSNWSADYFLDTAGVSFITDDQQIIDDVQFIFDRDWNSPYSSPVNCSSSPF